MTQSEPARPTSITLAPTGPVTPYDQCNLPLYAALLDAHSAGLSWRQVIVDLMHLDPNDAGAERCWQSHLERARWIVGDGLAHAVEAFGRPDAGEPR